MNNDDGERPTVAWVEGMESIHPGFAASFWSAQWAESDYQRERDRKLVDGGLCHRRRGQTGGFVIMVASLITAVILSFGGHPLAGAAIGGSNGVASALVWLVERRSAGIGPAD